MIAPLKQCTDWLRAYFSEPWLIEKYPVPAFHHPLFRKGICDYIYFLIDTESLFCLDRNISLITFHSGSATFIPQNRQMLSVI